ncbi:hypothetical protein JL475_17940, partial [Streptomyces sp. M2CJ-2]|uniref:hypothetical protein n=1 Tax=Streptomyces sp. M2CJ-2 TaxID=2803948 RepID=UPI00192660C8
MSRTSVPATPSAASAPHAADPPLPDAWEDLVTTALLGTDRRTPAGAAPAGDAGPTGHGRVDLRRRDDLVVQH